MYDFYGSFLIGPANRAGRFSSCMTL